MELEKRDLWRLTQSFTAEIANWSLCCRKGFRYLNIKVDDDDVKRLNGRFIRRSPAFRTSGMKTKFTL